MSYGSAWNIWDFHVHTPHSVLNNQFGDPNENSTWDRYVAKLEEKSRERSISAIGITDYFTIDGYKRVKQFKDKGHLENIMIFPNVEFRVDKVIYRQKDGTDPKRLNIHVLFSPDVPAGQIEEHFLHNLVFVHKDDPYNSADERKLKVSNLSEFGESLRKQHPEFRNRSAFEIGCTNATVRVDDIKKELAGPRFHGKYLIVLAEENTSLLDWDGQDHSTRKQLIQMSHAIFSSNDSSRRWCLGEKHDSINQFIDEYGSLKPCIWGCDSHGYTQRFLEPDNNRYCWIKADVTWEGLKQILHEPRERVRIQENSPEPTKSIYSLEAVAVPETQVNNTIRVNQIDIKLNPSLVAIIGGRGSGKTALLDLIAACFGEGRKLATLENSFYYRLYEKSKKKKGEPKSSPIPTKVTFQSGESFEKAVGADSAQDDNIFPSADILYVTQNHIEEYTANPFRLYEHIIELVFEKNADAQKQYETLVGEAEKISNDIQTLNLSYEQLTREIAGKLDEEQANHKKAVGEFADYQGRLAEQKKEQEGSGTETEKFTERLKELKDRKEKLAELLQQKTTLRADIQSFYNKYKLIAADINARTLVLNTDSLTKLPLAFLELDEVSALIDANLTAIKGIQPGIVNDISAVEQEIGSLEGISKTIADLQRQINEISTNITSIDTRIKSVLDKTSQIQELDKRRVDRYAELLRTVVEQRRFLQEMIVKFEENQDEMLESIRFSAVVDTSKYNDYIDSLMEKLDNRRHARNSVDESLSEWYSTLDNLLNDRLNSTSANEFSQVSSKLRSIVNSFSTKSRVSGSELFNSVFTPFFRIGLHIEFSGRPLEALSMGERAVILLKIILVLDDSPLLIDQPEEHLDNRYIYDKLTPAFRLAKTRRQIIIATHNANLVVNTDAEQIIVAEHKDNVLSYRAGTLENLEFRESIKTILEGGDQAFKKREQKYGYQF